MDCRSGVLASALLCLIAANAGACTPTLRDRTAALTHSLSEAVRRQGPAAAELLPILASLAQLRFEQAEFAKATELRRRSLKIAIAVYGSASVPAGKALAGLAHLYIEQRRYLDAEPLAIAAANVLRDRLGEFNEALAPILADRARIALATGDGDRARKWVKEAIAIDQRSGGGPHSDRLRVLGGVLAAREKFADSERVLQQALALDRAKGDELGTARSLAALAGDYLRQKHFAAALPPIEEAALIDQTHLGPTHPLIAEDFHDLGLIYLATNRPGDAAKAWQTAIDLLERGVGRATPTLGYIMLDLARAEHTLGHERKAQSLFTAAHRILNTAEDEERDRQRRA
jgi:tetratricopeptide (TPR) repeat protein